MDKVNRKNLLIAAGSLILIVAAIYFLFVWERKPKDLEEDDSISEVRELKDVELIKRPYVTLTPTSDGAEIIISLENMGEFDRIEYELTYLADNPQIAGEKIQRGATGTDVNTKDEKYKKSLLLGTASRGVRSPDRGITDGKLVMHMIKGDIEFQSETEWNFDQMSSTPVTIKSRDGNVELEIPGQTGKEYWVILADTIGLPPGSREFDPANVNLPIYGTFSIAPEFTKDASLSLKSDGIGDASSLYVYNAADQKWEKKDAKPKANKITTTFKSFGTFVTTAK